MIEYDAFTTALARDVAAKAVPEFLAKLEARMVAPEADPLLTAREVAKELGIGETTVRQIIEAGELLRAPGMTEIRVRRSVVRAYGTTAAAAGRKRK